MLIKAALIAIVALFGLGLLGFGVSMAWMAVRTAAQFLGACFEAWRSRGWPETTGTITRSVVVCKSSGRRHRSLAPGIAYAYQAAGQDYTGTRLAFCSMSHLGANQTHEPAQDVVSRLPKGARVPVYFDPDRPRAATLDRRRPYLGLPAFFLPLFLFGAAAFIPLGVMVLMGPVNDPPPFTDDELPTLWQQVGGLLAILGGLALPVAGVRILRARRHRPLLERLATVAQARVADVRPGQDVAVFGRAEASSAGAASSPVTGEPVVYHRAVVHSSGTPLSDVSQCDFYLRDESGTILVVTEDGTDHVAPRVLPDDPAVHAWVDSVFVASGLPVPEDFRVEVGQIVPGGPVLVVGRAERDRGRLVLASLVFSGEPLSQLVERLDRPAGRARRLAAAAALLVLVGVVLMLA